MQLDGYIRVSRIGGRSGEGYISPDDQRATIQMHADMIGATIANWETDEDRTGANLERPGFQRILARMERGESDGFIVKQIDRFARNTVDGLTIIRQVIGRDQVFISATEQLNAATPEGRYMLTQFLAIGELFVERIRASWLTAKGRAVDRGVHIGPTPVGYLRAKPEPTKPLHVSMQVAENLLDGLGYRLTPSMLVPDPHYGPAITRLFERAARGESSHHLAKWMTTHAPRHNDVPWSSSEIRRWLRNRTYLGEVAVRNVGTSAIGHPPLTDPATFLAAQPPPGGRRRTASKPLLSGLVRCASCRHSMVGHMANQRSGNLTQNYLCGYRSRGCPEPAMIAANTLNPYVAELATRHLEGHLTAVKSQQALTVAARELSAAEREVETFVADTASRSLMGDQVWRHGLELRVKDRDMKRVRHEALLRQESVLGEIVDLSNLTGDNLRLYLGGVIRTVWVRRGARQPPEDRTMIVWADDPRDFEIPGPHRSGPFPPVEW